jgi:putative DNA primase/helicase
MEAQKKPEAGSNGRETNTHKDNIICPTFNDLSLLSKPEALIIINHILELAKPGEPIPHNQIVAELLAKVEPVDFREIAELEEDEKIKNNHLLIISVEQLLSLAINNDWGICRNFDFIYLYNSAYWNHIEKNDFVSFLGNVAEKMGVDQYKAKHFQFREHLLKQFLVLAHLPKPEPAKDTVLINLKNGTFEISSTGTKLRGFDRKDFLTYQLPFSFNPDAKAPLFMKYLNRVLPDQERQQVVSEYLGYVFIHPSLLKLEKTLLLYGTGANGKSVLFDIVNALLGVENVSSYSLQSLTNENGYFRAKLANKLVNYASEISGNMETAIFKQLVSGEPVEARLPYGEPFNLSNYAKLIFNVNELPRDVEHTNAYFRRFLIIPFDVTIPEDEQNKELSKKIIETELEGVFNWILEGLHRLLEQRNFSKCEAAKIQVEQYRIESDTVQMFITEMKYEKDATQYTLLKTLYTTYRVFCSEDGFKPLNKTNFGRRLEGLGIIKDRLSDGYVFYLKTDLPY